MITSNPAALNSLQPYIEHVVGTIKLKDLQASALTRISYFVIDSFSAVTDFFARLVGSKNAIAHFQMRSQFYTLIKQLNDPTTPFLETLNSVTQTFSARVRAIETRNNPQSSAPLSEQQLLDLFIFTLSALSHSRENPLPPLTDKQVQQLKYVSLHPKPTNVPASFINTHRNKLYPCMLGLFTLTLSALAYAYGQQTTNSQPISLSNLPRLSAQFISVLNGSQLGESLVPFRLATLLGLDEKLNSKRIELYNNSIPIVMDVINDSVLSIFSKDAYTQLVKDVGENNAEVPFLVTIASPSAEIVRYLVHLVAQEINSIIIETEIDSSYYISPKDISPFYLDAMIATLMYSILTNEPTLLMFYPGGGGDVSKLSAFEELTYAIGDLLQARNHTSMSVPTQHPVFQKILNCMPALIKQMHPRRLANHLRDITLNAKNISRFNYTAVILQ